MKLLRLFKLVLTIRCSEASQLASDALDRTLDWDERIALRWHTFVCGPCRRWLQQLRGLREVLMKMPDRLRRDASDITTIRLSPERRQRIKQLLAEAQRHESN
ncbi:MAG: zf-HC2 domain-containing protein [Planctomycetes bacterium]|nr:zf-HC2 domain-containing protein [Planctomycetota bacterium]